MSSFSDLQNKYAQELMKYYQKSNKSTIKNTVLVNEPAPPSEGKGFISAEVRTAKDAIPIEGASVIIESYQDGKRSLITTLETDASGNTPLSIPLTAPSRESSLSPSVARPYGEYRIIVQATGFQTMEFENVPVFDQIVTLQQAEMVPKGE